MCYKTKLANILFSYSKSQRYMIKNISGTQQNFQQCKMFRLTRFDIPFLNNFIVINGAHGFITASKTFHTPDIYLLAIYHMHMCGCLFLAIFKIKINQIICICMQCVNLLNQMHAVLLESSNTVTTLLSSQRIHC